MSTRRKSQPQLLRALSSVQGPEQSRPKPCLAYSGGNVQARPNEPRRRGRAMPAPADVDRADVTGLCDRPNRLGGTQAIWIREPTDGPHAELCLEPFVRQLEF